MNIIYLVYFSTGELNAEERLTKIDEEHVETEKMIERQRKVLEDKSSEKYAKMNQLFQMRNEEKRLQTDIEGAYFFSICDNATGYFDTSRRLVQQFLLL